MLTVTLNELEVNQVARALSDQNLRDAAALNRMVTQGADQFDIDCVRAAIQQTIAARLAISEAIEEPEYPADQTFAALEDSVYVEPELVQRAMDGDR